MRPNEGLERWREGVPELSHDSVLARGFIAGRLFEQIARGAKIGGVAVPKMGVPLVKEILAAADYEIVTETERTVGVAPYVGIAFRALP